jgi:hypothetical protein
MKKFRLKRRTISEANKGLIPFCKGKHLSKNHRLHISQANTGRKLTEEIKKKISLNHADMSGKNNPFFGKTHISESIKQMSLSHGGTGIPNEKIRYPFIWISRKETIRERDNYTCQECNIKQKDYYRKLDVHHIDYDKQNCSPKNLITLCHNCYMYTNGGNRDYYYAYYTYIMEQVYE